MTPNSVMERKKKKKKVCIGNCCWVTHAAGQTEPHSSLHLHPPPLVREKVLEKYQLPPCPASSPVASVHRETVQATAMASCASWGRRFFCLNSQLGKASEVTLEKCMHQRKKLWKGGGGGGQCWSPHVLYV